MIVMRRIVALGSLVAVVGAGSGWGADTPVSPGLPADQAGAKLYAVKCASCHAKDGKGHPAMAKVFKLEPAKLSVVNDATTAKSDADLIKITSEGSGKMPPYKGKLTEAEIKDLVAYIRTLAPAKP